MVVVVELVVLVVVELVELVEVLLVVPGTQTDSRHSPVLDPGNGGAAQGHSAGQSPPIHRDPSHFMMQGEPQPGVVVVGGGTAGGGQGHSQVPQVQ